MFLSQANGHRVVIFSQWTDILDLLEIFLKSIGMSFLRLLRGESGTKQSTVTEFNSNQSITVMLSTWMALNSGKVKLSGVDTVIYHDTELESKFAALAEVSVSVWI